LLIGWGILFESVQTNLKDSLNIFWITTKFVGIRRRIVSVNDKTFKRDLKETQNSLCHTFSPELKLVEKGRSLNITMFEAKSCDTVYKVPRSALHKMFQTVV
jgi:hypothetical protein